MAEQVYLWSVASVVTHGAEERQYLDGVVSTKDAAKALARKVYLELPMDYELRHAYVEKLMVDDPHPGFVHEGWIGTPNDNEELGWEEA